MLAFVCVVAALCSLLATPLVLRVAASWGLYDVPTDGRRVHTQPIPRLGGVAVFASTAVGLLVLAVSGNLTPHPSLESWKFFVGLLLGGGIAFAAGLWDDLRGLSPVSKLGAQCVSAAVVFAFGFRIEALSLGSAMQLDLGWFALPLTIVWVVGVTNAFNLIDGLDGLATGIAVVALGTTLAVALALGNVEVAVVCVALLGALLGFLRYNFSPARIFLGDSGSLFVGFMLAVLSVHGSLKSATAVLVIIPLFALALPLLDTLLAIGRRWLRGMPLSGADARHIHHRLLALGLTHRSAAIVMYLVAIGLAVLGLSLAFAPPTAVISIAIAGGGITVLLLLYGMRHLQYHEFAEAGAVLASGVLRIRRVIQDQIHARDVAQIIQQAETLEQVDAILEDNAVHFGFLAVEVCREMSRCRRRIGSLNGQAARAWKLDYLITPRQNAEDDPYVLRIWCGLGRAYRPFGAERVARVLAPTIEQWLLATSLVDADSEAPDLQPVPNVGERGGTPVEGVFAWAHGSRALGRRSELARSHDLRRAAGENRLA